MARRRKIEIKATELECYYSLVKELSSRPGFAGFDPRSIRVWAYEEHEPVIADVNSAIYNLDRWMSMYGDKIQMYEGVQIVEKKDIAKALGISRPTLYKWIEDGLLDGCTVLLGQKIECYQLNLIRDKLVFYRDARR